MMSSANVNTPACWTTGDYLMKTGDLLHKPTRVFLVHFGLIHACLEKLPMRSPILKLLPTKHV